MSWLEMHSHRKYLERRRETETVSGGLARILRTALTADLPSWKPKHPANVVTGQNVKASFHVFTTKRRICGVY